MLYFILVYKYKAICIELRKTDTNEKPWRKHHIEISDIGIHSRKFHGEIR